MDTNFTAKREDAGERLDKWLLKKLPRFSRNQIKALLDDGRVLINRRRVLIAGWEIETNDNVEVRIPEHFGKERLADKLEKKFEKPVEVKREPKKEQQSAPKRELPTASRFLERRKPKPVVKKNAPEKVHLPFRLQIYHEDRDIIVVEKPSGMLTIPHNDANDRRSLIAEVRNYMRRKHRGSRHSFVAPLHRLDSETSGIVVFALSRVGQKLESQFKEHSIKREYTAIVEGAVKEQDGVIDLPLEKGDFRGGKKVRVATEEGKGKKALTIYRVVERYPKATILNVRVHTGRTHQIRVHLAEKGYPLIGDKLYLEDRGTIPFYRHALHAHFLEFRHPANGSKLTFHSELPEDMKQLIDDLRT